MATSATLTVGFTQLPEPCWELPNDDLAHYDTEQDAAEVIESDPERYAGGSPRQCTFRCWTAQAACGAWVDYDQFQVGHHHSYDDAMDAALNADFVVVDGVLRCEDGEFCEAKP